MSAGGWRLAGVPEKNPRSRRDYRPTVEGLEALRLLSSATQAHALTDVAAERDLLADPSPLGDDALTQGVSTATWDEALVQTELGELLNSAAHTSLTTSSPASSPTTVPQSTTADSDPVALASGLSQLNKYLNKTWYRAGIPVQLHDDSSQAVYATLLQNMGRGQFDALVAEVGHWGVKDVFSRETSNGLSFFRAVDMVKKRAQRERSHQSLESVDVSSEDRSSGSGSAALREALQEAIHRTLSPREAALIRDTLLGKTPAEIAIQWGVAPKTVSNEKTRVLQKLRSALADYEMN
jgi:DNA-binding CsgD family transcriptional regulator